MYTRRSLVLGLLSAGLLLAQDAQTSVQITGAVKQALTLTAGDLAKLPRATVLTTSNGMETIYQGVWLHEAGLPFAVSASIFSLSMNTGSSRRARTPLDSCSAPRADSGWWRRRTNLEHARSEC
jgi:hypothetical protein